MQAKAKSKYIRMSPRKISRVLDLVMGKRVDKALDILHFTSKSATDPIEKAIRSAVSNLGNLEEGQRLDLNEIYITKAFVDQGPTLKRWKPRAMGRATRINKRTSHIRIVIDDAEF